MFGELSNYLLSAREKNLTPIIGGDFNCQYGDLNIAFQHANRLYNTNMDATSNKHGQTYGKDLCKLNEIFALNHLTNRGKVFDGDFTYHKGDKKTQIDYVYTNKGGLNYITDFTIRKDDWHLSDNKPISIDLIVPFYINYPSS